MMTSFKVHMLRIIVLKIIQEKPDIYGYEIKNTIDRHAFLDAPFQAGTLYPIIHHLENSRLITITIKE